MRNIMFAVIIIITFFSCKGPLKPNAENSKSIIIGRIDNLPDGKIYLMGVPDDKKVLDSTVSKNGTFQFSVMIKKNDRFSNVTLKHKDTQDSIREFLYKTNKFRNNKPIYLDYFLLEDSVKITGRLIDFKAKGFPFVDKYKMVMLTNQLVGKQSWVIYNVSPKFPARIGDTLSFYSLRDTIKKYPYSYYLLSELESHIETLTKKESTELLSIFDPEIKGTPLWISIEKIVSKLSNNPSKIGNIKLKTSNNDTKAILNTNATNIIIFWASWCKPCREEIPELKKVFDKYGKDNKVVMSSISFDDDEKSWRKALIEEKMPWSQFIISNQEQKRELLYSFRVDPTIPATFIVNNKGEILEKVTGYDSKKPLVDLVNQLLIKHKSK